MTDILIILAAGASSRMKKSLELQGDQNAVSFKSKALIKLGDEQRPAVDFLVDHAMEAGYKEIIFVVNDESEAFRAYFGDIDHGNSYKKCSISYAIQKVPEGREKPLGTADALLQVFNQYPSIKNKNVVVCNADNLYSVQALSILAQCPEPNALISYDREGLKFDKERILSFALLVTNNENNLEAIVEKPNEDDSKRYQDAFGRLHISMNLWKFFGHDIVPHLQNCPVHPERNEKELPSAVRLLLETEGKAVKSFPLREHVPDLTSAEDIAIVEDYLRNKKSPN